MPVARKVWLTTAVLMPSVARAALDHGPGFDAIERPIRQLARARQGREEGAIRLVLEARAFDIFGQVFLKRVVAGHFMALAAFLAQTHPEPVAFVKEIGNRHADRRADAREGVGHETDQRAVAQTGDGVGINGGQQLPGFLAVEHRRFAAPDAVARTAHARRPDCWQ